MDNYREYNKRVAARVSEFQRLVAHKNTGLANSLDESIIPLLKADYRLDRVSRDYLVRITGRSERTVEYILKLISGVKPEELLKSVTRTHSTRLIVYQPKTVETDETEGLRENAVKDLENIVERTE